MSPKEAPMQITIDLFGVHLASEPAEVRKRRRNG